MMMQAGTKQDPINKAAPLKTTPSVHKKNFLTKSSVPTPTGCYQLQSQIPNTVPVSKSLARLDNHTV